MYIFRFSAIETTWCKKQDAWLNYQAARKARQMEAEKEKKAKADKLEADKAEKLRTRKDEKLPSGDGVASAAMKAKLKRGRLVFFVTDVFLFHVVLRQVLC